MILCYVIFYAKPRSVCRQPFKVSTPPLSPVFATDPKKRPVSEHPIRMQVLPAPFLTGSEHSESKDLNLPLTLVFATLPRNRTITPIIATLPKTLPPSPFLATHTRPSPRLSGSSLALFPSLATRHWALATALERCVQDLHEHVAVEEAFAPSVLQVGKRLGGYGFLRGFSGGLQLPDALARGDEHVAELGEVGLVPQRPVAGDDFHRVVRERQNFVRCSDHSIHAAAGDGINVGIEAVEECVAHVDDVGFLKVDEDVRVGVSGRKVLQRKRFAVGLQLVCGGEGLLRQSFGGRGGEVQAEDEQVVRLRHALLGVFMRKNRSAGGVQRPVVVDVVEMPVGVDDLLQRRITDRVERFFELGPGRQNESRS